jgi:hypothetical protein
MYILVGMLAIGFVCNLLVRPVADKWFMTDAELAEEKRLAHDRSASNDVGRSGKGFQETNRAIVVLAWLAVGIPLAWGIYRTLLSVAKFFH